MKDNKLDIIRELMDELVDSMELGESDFDSRLGRKKPEVKIEIESHKEDPSMEEEMNEEDMDKEEIMEDVSPEEKLKNRLMKLRR